MADDTDIAAAADTADQGMQQLEERQRALALGADRFATAMTGAFSRAVAGGRQLDDVLKSLALRMSDMVLRAALQPLAGGLASGLQGLVGGLLGSVQKSALGGVKPFAAGGVIGTPTYFPLTSGGVGLAGEAGPEAIMPLARGPDGRLGVAASGRPAQVTIQIVTPDVDGFRRAEVHVAGQIARAVARGQRDM